MLECVLKCARGRVWVGVELRDRGKRKIDLRSVGIAEGLNAGTWTVGVALTGNAFGLTPDETAALQPDDFVRRRAAATADLLRSGAHYVIDTVADIDAVIDAIEGRLARGERP